MRQGMEKGCPQMSAIGRNGFFSKLIAFSALIMSIFLFLGVALQSAFMPSAGRWLYALMILLGRIVLYCVGSTSIFGAGNRRFLAYGSELCAAGALLSGESRSTVSLGIILAGIIIQTTAIAGSGKNFGPEVQKESK